MEKREGNIKHSDDFIKTLLGKYEVPLIPTKFGMGMRMNACEIIATIEELNTVTIVLNTKTTSKMKKKIITCWEVQKKIEELYGFQYVVQGAYIPLALIIIDGSQQMMAQNSYFVKSKTVYRSFVKFTSV